MTSTFGVCFVVAFPGHLRSLSFSKRVKLIHIDLFFITGKIITPEVGFVLYCNDQVFSFIYLFIFEKCTLELHANHPVRSKESSKNGETEN